MQDSENNSAAEQQPAPPGGCSGKVIILLLFGLAAAAAVFMIWVRHHQQRRCIELWGTDVAMRILNAPRVELWQLAHAPQGAKNPHPKLIDVAGKPMVVKQRKNVSAEKAIKDIRKALIRDDFFDWDEDLSECQPQWTHALRFARDDSQSTIVFDFHCGRVLLHGTNKEASIVRMSKQIKEDFAKLFLTAEKENGSK